MFTDQFKDQIHNQFNKFALIFASSFLSMTAHAYNIDSSRVYISGLSSGAYMAGQVHVAYSSIFKGAGLLAGGPYYCAQSNLSRALTLCSEPRAQLPTVGELVTYARTLERHQQIDPLDNLAGQKIAVVVGEYDQVVPLALTRLNIDFYSQVSRNKAQSQLFQIAQLGHAYPTPDKGNPCESLRQTPFISRCNFDGAGAIMNYLEPSMQTRGRADANHFYTFSQKLGRAETSSLSLSEEGVAYIPAACQNGQRCGLHVAVHGCRQTPEHIGRAFVEMTGYNEWAETNKMIIIYPQAKPSQTLGNPLGCWDWWGYLGANYATRDGVQVKFIKQLVDIFSAKGWKL